jgi:hypothetical protein
VEYFRQVFAVQADCSPAELERAAKTSVALDRLVAEHALGSMAYYHMGTGSEENEDAISSIILGNSLLTARGIPVAGEYEVKNAQAMKILDSFGVGGSFTEYYAMDWHDNVVLMGHDGPGHIAIAEGRAKAQILEGQGEASKITQIGEAEAAVFARKIAAYGDPRLFALRDVAERFANSKQPLVPERLFMTGNGGGDKTQGGLMQTLLALLIAEKSDMSLTAPSSAGNTPENVPASEGKVS